MSLLKSGTCGRYVTAQIRYTRSLCYCSNQVHEVVMLLLKSGTRGRYVTAQIRYSEKVCPFVLMFFAVAVTCYHVYLDDDFFCFLYSNVYVSLSHFSIVLTLSR